MKTESLTLHLIVLFTFASCFYVGAAEEGYLGSWRPVELDSGYFKQVDIYEWAGKVSVRTFPSMNGGEKSASGTVLQAPIPSEDAKKAGAGKAPFQIVDTASFKETTYTFSLTQQGLQINAVDVYTDDSNRGTMEHDLHFVRGTYESAMKKEGGKKSVATESGWLGIWKNRDENTRGIAQLTIRDVGPVAMSAWGIMSGGISSRPVVELHLPITAEEAGHEGASGSIEAKKDLNWAVITYEMTLHKDELTIVAKTDYTDPDRGDQSFEYEFERGAWAQ